MKTTLRNNADKSIGMTIWIRLCFILFTIFTIATMALAAAALAIVVNRLGSKKMNSETHNKSTTLVEQIKISDLMAHLEQLQVIADRSNGTRAIATDGFNGTLEYITSQLEQNTDLIVQHTHFTVRNYIIRGTPELWSNINGNVTKYDYLKSFTQILFSSRADFESFVSIIAVSNFGCDEADWTNLSVADSVALVSRGSCTYLQKSALAEKYRVKGLLIYNHGLPPDGLQALQGVRNNLNTTIPAFFVSHLVGTELLNAIDNAKVMMKIDVSDANGVGNICADTKTGDKTKTILVGSHSDGVPAGSGINDNGSGTIGNLVLALNLARLFETSSFNYTTYRYRIRFCWWGAEELGLLGSQYHVQQAASPNSTIEGERLIDYLVNLNYDMLAGPNYRFGIHDASTVPSTTPKEAVNGTMRITSLFRQWFDEQKLPWSNASLGGGSDYVPFLAAGIAVGGVNTGAGGLKSATERDRYAAILGTGHGGMANAAFDPCYHQQCDRIRNINPFAFENVVKAAAHALEYLGRLNDLETWLYPTGRRKYFELLDGNSVYNFANDFSYI